MEKIKQYTYEGKNDKPSPNMPKRKHRRRPKRKRLKDPRHREYIEKIKKEVICNTGLTW